MLAAGRLALLLGVAGCGLAGICGLLRPAWTIAVRRLAAMGAAGAAVAVVVLGRAFVGHDFSLVYVADHTRRGVGAWDRVGGLWGGMAGSLLLFATFVVVLGWGGTRTARATAVVAGAGGALLGAGRWLADPFRTLAVPAIDGSGLTPILEHPAMRVHPPIVYLGLCALVVPFALAVTAEGTAWWAPARRWLLASWALLGLGMVIGAWWAYAELGWGGYWAWDPVENAALLPWLAATVALHLGPRGAPTRAGVAAAAAPFPLAVLGATLTRSGATGSVHAFAEARSIGRALLVLLGVVTVGLVAVTMRRRSVRVDRPWALTAGVAVLVTITGLVTAGTIVPAVRAAFGGDRSLIDGRWFAQTNGPAAVLGLLLLATSSPRAGRGADADGRAGPVSVLARAGIDRRWAARVGAGAAVGATARVAAGWPAFACVLAVAAVAAGLAAVANLRRPTGVAHLGIAVLLVGVAGTTTGADRNVELAVGERVELAGHEVVLRDIVVDDGPVRESAAVVAVVAIDGHERRPALVAFPERNVLLAETALRSTPLTDVQVLLRTASDDDRALLTVRVHPLQQWVWWGGIMTVAAGALAFRRRASVASRPPVPSRSAAAGDDVGTPNDAGRAVQGARGDLGDRQ